MFDTDKEIYQFIVDDLYRLEDKDWIMITLNIERATSSSIGFDGEYINNLGETKWLFDIWEGDSNLDTAFHRLYEIMTQETDKHKWNRLEITLENAGEFNIKFEWDQELFDEIERLNNQYDPRTDNTLTQEEKNLKYAEMVKNGELPDISGVNINYI